MSDIYLTAIYGRIHEMQEVAEQLKAAGHDITSQWIYAPINKSLEQAALMDLDDIDAADTLVAFTLKPGSLYTGGGRHVEFGYAYASHKRIFIVGEKGENVFHYLPGIIHVKTVDELIEALHDDSGTRLPLE